MSLTSMIDSKEHRELFKAIAPPKTMFRSLTQDPPFAKAEPKTPGRFQLPESALIGMAFDYLLRAQVARWTGIPGNTRCRGLLLMGWNAC